MALKNEQRVKLVELAYRNPEEFWVREEGSKLLKLTDKSVKTSIDHLIRQEYLVRFKLSAEVDVGWAGHMENIKLSTGKVKSNDLNIQHFNAADILIESWPYLSLSKFKHNIYYLLVTQNGKDYYKRTMKKELSRETNPQLTDILENLQNLDSHELTRIIAESRKLKKLFK